MIYSELISLIASYLDREDLDTEIKGFIASVESKLNRSFRLGRMTQRAYTVGNGVKEWFAFPDDYLSCRTIEVNNVPLEYLTPEQMSRRVGISINQAYYYTIQAQQFRVIPIVGEDVELIITYYQKVPALSDTNITNWVLNEYFDLYYYGALAEAMLYIKNYEIYELWNQKFQSAADQMDSADRQDRWSGSPASVRSI